MINLIDLIQIYYKMLGKNLLMLVKIDGINIKKKKKLKKIKLIF